VDDTVGGIRGLPNDSEYGVVPWDNRGYIEQAVMMGSAIFGFVEDAFDASASFVERKANE